MKGIRAIARRNSSYSGPFDSLGIDASRMIYRKEKKPANNNIVLQYLAHWSRKFSWNNEYDLSVFCWWKKVLDSVLDRKRYWKSNEIHWSLSALRKNPFKSLRIRNKKRFVDVFKLISNPKWVGPHGFMAAWRI